MVILFCIIAVMRVIQSLCNKSVSNQLQNTKTFFLYGIYYQGLAALFSGITLTFTGFGGFKPASALCGFVAAVFLMINSYASLTVIKYCKLILSSIFNFGGMIVCFIFSWFLFGEKMSVLQAVGLALFFLAAYLISSSKKETQDEKAQPRRMGKRVIILLLIVMLSEGFLEISQKYYSVRIADGSIAWFSFFMFLSNAVIMSAALGVNSIKRKGRAVQQPLDSVPPQEKAICLNKVLWICGALLAFAVFIINLLVTELGKRIGSVVLFPVSASISICITVLVGWLVYKEKLTAKNIIGVVLGLLAIIVLSVFTPEMTSKIFS